MLRSSFYWDTVYVNSIDKVDDNANLLLAEL